MDAIERVKKALKSKTLTIGYNTTIRALRTGKAELVVIANNTPASTEKEIEHLAKVAGTELSKFEKSNLELGAACKKPFGVMIVAVTREKK